MLSVLTECARLHRPARKFLKAQVWQRPRWALVALVGTSWLPWPRLRAAASPGAAPTEGREDAAGGGRAAAEQAGAPHDAPGH